VGRENAEAVLHDLYTADPDTRAKLLEQLKERGVLDMLCTSVGWADIKQLHDSLGYGNAAIKKDLQRYFLGKDKFGPSMGEEWEDHDTSLHSVIGRLGAVGKVLNFTLDVGTFGFHSSYGKAVDDHSNGLTSDSEAREARGHAALRTAAVALVSTLTGGAAANAVKGSAKAVSAGRAVASGAAAGSTGAVAALATSDAYNVRPRADPS
jgi:hypothetical protein